MLEHIYCEIQKTTAIIYFLGTARLKNSGKSRTKFLNLNILL